MKLRVRAVIALFSLFVLFACGGCGSSETQADVKLISAAGEVDGYSTQSSYTYDRHDRLTSLYSKTVIDGGLPVKLAMPLSSERASEYKLEYDDNGNITRVQLWTEVFDDEALISSVLYAQFDYTYLDNILTESVELRFDGYSMTDYCKKSYDYDEAGDLITIQEYRSEGGFKAFASTPYRVFTMAYDVRGNLTQVERKYTGEPDYGTTYVMTYNADNQMVKHQSYNGVDLVVDENLIAVDTYEMVYDAIADTVTVTDTDNASYSTVLGFLGKDIGYLNPTAGMYIGGISKAKSAGPIVGSSATLIPSKLVHLMSVSLADDNYRSPTALLAAQQLIIESTYLYTGAFPTETVYFDTVLDENRYPQTMTVYNDIDADGLAVNFIWE